MGDITARHAALISGLSKLYNTLIAMRYIFADDIVHPPHTKEAIASDTLQTLGYEAGTIELIAQTPFLQGKIAWGWQKDGTEILPRSKAVSYLNDCESEWNDYLRWGDHTMSPNHKLLPPWMLRLTIGQMYSGQYGTDLIYDTRSGMIVEWSRTSKQLWDEAPSRPAEVVLARIVQNFKSLDWVPYFDESSPNSRGIMENPICFRNSVPGTVQLPLEAELAITQLRRESTEQNVSALRVEINRWRSLQKLYQDCGWNTSGYDATELEERRRQWFGRLKELERQCRLARCMSEAEREELTMARERFWITSAGANAV